MAVQLQWPNRVNYIQSASCDDFIKFKYLAIADTFFFVTVQTPKKY